jgi:Spy/CpxP family protein refolding chaperone
MNRTRILGLAAVLALGTSFTYAQTGNPAPQGDRQARMQQRTQQFQEKRLDRMATVLDLTEDQKTRAKAIFEASAAQQKQLNTQAQTLHQQMREAMDTGNSAQVNALIDQRSRLMADRMKIQANAQLEFRKLLTPAQLEKAKQLRGSFGQGAHPGKGKGFKGGKGRGGAGFGAGRGA